MGLVVLGTTVVIGPSLATAAGSPPGLALSYNANEQYLFPGVAGMSNQTTYADYILQNAANVTITVLDANNNVVKTIQTAVSEQACTYNNYCTDSVAWDGTNDQGQIVAPGKYTVQIQATNQAGTDTVDVVRDVANPGAPGSLTTPSNGATLQGTAGFVFTPSASFPSGFTITSVYVSCFGTSSAPAADGTWQGSGDTSQCENGSQTLSDYVYFTDPLGASQSWTDPSPPTVTIANGPGLALSYNANEQYLFPGVAGMSNQTTYADYILQNAANVTITVLDANNNVVKTIQTAVSEQACTYNNYCTDSVAWDGTNDQGQIVAPGKYTVQIQATNQAGTDTVDVVRDVANPGAPGSLTTPSNGATLQGTAGFVFTPSASFPSGFTITSVYVSCFGTSSAPAADGTWQGSGDTSQCENGSQTLSDYVYFTDPLGASQSWTDPSPPTVTIANGPGLALSYNANEQYLFPGVAGMSNQTTYADYILQNAANVTITVLDANNNVVKTIQTAVSEQACTYNNYCTDSVAWDGTNDQGQIVAPGKYTVQIQATNQAGTDTVDVVRDVANPGAPGSLTTPSNGATLQGTAGFVFTPSAVVPLRVHDHLGLCVLLRHIECSGRGWDVAGERRYQPVRKRLPDP